MVANPITSHSPVMATSSEHESAIPAGCSSCRQLHADIQIFVHQVTDQISDKLDRLALRVEELFIAQKNQNYTTLNNNNSAYPQYFFNEFAKQRQCNNYLNGRKSSTISSNNCNLMAFEQAIKNSFIGEATILPNSPKYTNGKKRGSVSMHNMVKVK